jgi:2,3-bisphosphoglycerate-independent phosphoglycerate mutase
MLAPTKIIAGLGLSLGVDILEAPGATGDYRTLLTSKASAIAKALSAPLNPCPNVFVPGEDEHKPGHSDGYDFGFLHIKVITYLLLKCVMVSDLSYLDP